MKVFGIFVFNCNEPNAVILSKCLELSSFGYFQKSSAEDVMKFVARELIKKTTDKQSVAHLDYIGFARVNSDKLGAVVLTDKEYPSRVGNHLAGLVLAKFAQLYTQPTSWKEIKSDSTLFTPDFEALLQQSQTPDKVDDIEKIRKDLDETQETLHKTINDLLVRGQKLDDLADQSEDLGVFSREFLKRSESMNGGCCLLL